VGCVRARAAAGCVRTQVVWGARAAGFVRARALRVGLYTMLPLPILYGVWHTQGRLGEVVVCCALVVQSYCNDVDNTGGGAIK